MRAVLDNLPKYMTENVLQHPAAALRRHGALVRYSARCLNTRRRNRMQVTELFPSQLEEAIKKIRMET